MWWMLAAGPMAGLMAWEARRFLRERAAERSGARTYALYAAGRPDRPLRLITIDDDAHGPENTGLEAETFRDARPAPMVGKANLARRRARNGK